VQIIEGLKGWGTGRKNLLFHIDNDPRPPLEKRGLKKKKGKGGDRKKKRLNDILVPSRDSANAWVTRKKRHGVRRRQDH